jgi:hypothetical protein
MAKTDKSWNFIYKITDQVNKKFSEGDLQAVLDCGKALVNNGATYQHIAGAASATKQKAKSAESTPSKSGDKKQQQGAEV